LQQLLILPVQVCFMGRVSTDAGYLLTRAAPMILNYSMVDGIADQERGVLYVEFGIQVFLVGVYGIDGLAARIPTRHPCGKVTTGLIDRQQSQSAIPVFHITNPFLAS
jgi:hypothetical protein